MFWNLRKGKGARFNSWNGLGKWEGKEGEAERIKWESTEAQKWRRRPGVLDEGGFSQWLRD